MSLSPPGSPIMTQAASGWDASDSDDASVHASPTKKPKCGSPHIGYIVGTTPSIASGSDQQGDDSPTGFQQPAAPNCWFPPPKALAGNAWWQDFFYKSFRDQRQRCGVQMRPFLHESLCSGTIGEKFGFQVDPPVTNGVVLAFAVFRFDNSYLIVFVGCV